MIREGSIDLIIEVYDNFNQCYELPVSFTNDSDKENSEEKKHNIRRRHYRRRMFLSFNK